MATIKSGSSTDLLGIDPTSKAARTTLYDSAGNEIDAGLIRAGNVVDANNTTTSALGAGATFTGTATNILNYNQVSVKCFGRPGIVAGDGLSAMASLWVDISDDGTNWDTSIPSLVRDPSLIIPTPLIFVGAYLRVRYINDGGVSAIAALNLSDTAGTPTAQTAFRLTTYLLPMATAIITRTMDQGISGSDPTILVRAGVMGELPVGGYANKRSSGVSKLNNSTAVLGPAAVFTGGWEDATGFAQVGVSVDADLVGTITFEQSINGTDVVGPVTRSFTNVSGGQNMTFIPITQFVRLKFTNTAGTQAFFRFETTFKAEAMGSIFAPINTPLVPQSLAQVVVAVPTDGAKTTYSASVSGLSSAATPTDIFSITGSATKTVRILRVGVSGTKTTAGQIDLLFLKRSTANTGGTSTAPTMVPHDSSNAAATATVLAYTANPTTGTLVGAVRSDKIFIPSTGTGSDGGSATFLFGDLGQSIVLRGTAQVFAINLNGVTAVGGSFSAWVEFQEE